MALMDLTKGYVKAKKEFTSSDPLQMAIRSGTAFDRDKQQFEIYFLGDNYLISYTDGDIKFKDPQKTDEIPLEVEILLMHYLYNASGLPLQNKLISFKELDNGFLYIGPFTGRAITPLISIFGKNPTKMLPAARLMGGESIDLGDVAVRIPALPLLPITCVIWEGDDEFPPSGNILFDGSAGTHLATEDFAFLASMLVFKLKALAQ